jgi:hypothetical protein
VYSGLSIDNGQTTYHLYAAEYNLSTSTAAFGAFDVGSPTFIQLQAVAPGAGDVLGTAFDPSGNVWYLLNTGTAAQAVELNPATITPVASISGLPSTSSGITVDAAGNVYIATGAANIEEFSPPGYGTPANIPLAGAFNITAVPTALFGNNNQQGVQSPLPSPFPLPTITGF